MELTRERRVQLMIGSAYRILGLGCLYKLLNTLRNMFIDLTYCESTNALSQSHFVDEQLAHNSAKPEIRSSDQLGSTFDNNYGTGIHIPKLKYAIGFRE